MVIAAAGLLACIGCSSGRTSAVAPPAPAASAANGNVIGYDVSYPQCGVALPKHPAFAVVGVNDTLANNFNPCLPTEVAWARTATGVTAQPKLSYYVHTADPGNTVADWPKLGTNPDGACTGGNTNACAYQYGEDLGLHDLLHLGGLAYKGVTFYIDTETGYAYGPPARNVAVLEGMTSAFQASGDKVGLYSNASEWQAITGNTLSPALAMLPVWILGATSVSGAKQNCASPSFAGPIELAQAASASLDADVSCRH